MRGRAGEREERGREGAWERARETDHELLHGETVAGVRAAVDHVHPGDGHHELLHRTLDSKLDSIR